jgi:hypothetical protein
MFKLTKLRWQKRKVEKSYEPDLTKAFKEKDEQAIHTLTSDLDYAVRPIEGRIFAEITRRITEEAEMLDVEIPPYNLKDGFWGWDGYGQLTYLTPRGRSQLRKLIDEEKARRFEANARRIKLLLPFVAALAALVGALTGLVLAFHK